MAQPFMFRGLSCGDVRLVRGDTDALEALVDGARPGLLTPSSVEERAAAAHRAARLAPRHGSAVQFGLEWHRLELLNLAFTEWWGRDQGAVGTGRPGAEVGELQLEMLKVQAAPRSLGFLVTALAPLGEPVEAGRAADAVRMRAGGRRLSGIAREFRLDGPLWAEMLVRRGLFERIDALAERYIPLALAASDTELVGLTAQLRGPTPGVHVARRVLERTRERCELLGLIAPPRPGSRR